MSFDDLGGWSESGGRMESKKLQIEKVVLRRRRDKDTGEN